MNNLSVEEHHHHSVKHPAFAKIIHFFKWWLGLTGLIAATSVCPFCGHARVSCGSRGGDYNRRHSFAFHAGLERAFQTAVSLLQKSKEKSVK